MSKEQRIADLLRQAIKDRQTLAVGNCNAAATPGQSAIYTTQGGNISAIATNFCYGQCLLAKVEGKWYAVNPSDTREVVRSSVDRFIQRKVSVFTPDRYLVIRAASYYDPWFIYNSGNATVDSPRINFGKLPCAVHFTGIVPNVAVIFQRSIAPTTGDDYYIQNLVGLTGNPLYQTTVPLTESAIGTSIAANGSVFEIQVDTEQWAGSEIDIRVVPCQYKSRHEIGVDTFSGLKTLIPPTFIEFEVESRDYRDLEAQPTIDEDIATVRPYAQFLAELVYTGEQELARFSNQGFTTFFRDVFYRVAFRVNYNKESGEILIT